MKKIILCELLTIILLFSSCGGGGNFDLIPVSLNGKWGYIDHKGVFVINPQFKSAECFFDGLARVKSQDGKVGYINEEGKYVINANYVDGTRFGNGLVFVTPDGYSIKCLDTKGNEIYTLPETTNKVGYFNDGIAVVIDNHKVGYIKTSGDYLINPTFESGKVVNPDKRISVSQEGKWGFCDYNGVLVINPQFDKVHDFYEGLCGVFDGKQWGFIDNDGKYVINPQFDDIDNFSEGLCAVKQGSQWGFIDKSGKIVINPQFDYCTEFKSSLSPICQGLKWGFVNKDGKIVINPQFDMVTPFYDDISVVMSNGKIGIINKDGRYEVNPQFENVSTPSTVIELIKTEPKPIETPQQTTTQSPQDNTQSNISKEDDFITTVLAHCHIYAEYLDKPYSDFIDIGNATINGNMVSAGANVKLNHIIDSKRFWLFNSDVSKSSSKAQMTGLYLQYDNFIEDQDIQQQIIDLMYYIDENGMYDGCEFCPDFSYGETDAQYGHYFAWAFNGSNKLSFLIDHEFTSVTIYVSRNKKQLDKLMTDILNEAKNNLSGESIENMW